jgi:polysaccharide biosynthesis transport protein
MSEDLEEKSPAGFDLPHYLGMVRRRHMQFLIPLFLGWLAVWGASWVLPPRYRVEHADSGGAAHHAEGLCHAQRERRSAGPAAEHHPADSQPHPACCTSSTSSICTRIRTASLRPTKRWSGCARISTSNWCATGRPDHRLQRLYSSRDPHVAQQVTSELTNLFINENLEVRQQQSEDTTKFLESQLETARKILSDQEEKIREFKGQHVGELPAQVGSNLQILAGMQSQLQSEEDALNTAKQQRVYLETW